MDVMDVKKKRAAVRGRRAKSNGELHGNGISFAWVVEIEARIFCWHWRSSSIHMPEAPGILHDTRRAIASIN